MHSLVKNLEGCVLYICEPVVGLRRLMRLDMRRRGCSSVFGLIAMGGVEQQVAIPIDSMRGSEWPPSL